MHMFGTYPLKGEGEPGRGLVRCERCGRVVLEWASSEHKRKPSPCPPSHAGGCIHAEAGDGGPGICAHVLDGAPLENKKPTKVEKKDEAGKKRPASEGPPIPIPPR